MKYYREDSKVADLLLYLRNKNLAIYPKERRLPDKVSDHLAASAAEQKVKSMKKRGFQLVVSEQIVEYPMVLRNVNENAKKILDFGGVESLLPLQLSALGHQVTVLDQRPYPFCHPNLEVINEDLFSEDLKAKMTELFDVVISISTIEHLGLGRYGDLVHQDKADARGVQILWDFVRQGGRLLASVPAGKPAIQRGYRVYNEEKLKELFPHVTSVYWFVKEGREETWSLVDAEKLENHVYSEPYGQMPAEGVAFVICDKK